MKALRLPLQGGLPPADGVSSDVVEIACDESGFSGSNLLDPATPVFTHASVDLQVDEAVELINGLRSGFRWSFDEFKSGHFFRGQPSGDALEWLTESLSGRGQVQVIDKGYFLVTRIVDLFLFEPTYAAGTRLTQQHRPAALALYRAGRRQGHLWTDFLAAFADLVRTKRRHQLEPAVVTRFFQTRDSLTAGLDTDAADLLRGFTRDHVEAVVTRLTHGDTSIPPPLEPLIPALAETVLHWSGGRRQVLVIHDEQSALTAGRLRRLQEVLAQASPRTSTQTTTPQSALSPLAGLVSVDSRDDPRVQVADLLAGLARRSPNTGDDDPLQPFLSPTSLRDPEQHPAARTVRRG